MNKSKYHVAFIKDPRKLYEPKEVLELFLYDGAYYVANLACPINQKTGSRMARQVATREYIQAERI